MALARTIGSYAELLQLLNELKAPHRAHPERQTVDVDLAPELPGPMHVRWEKEVPFVQLIQPVLVNVPAERVRDIEAAVLRVNNASVFPGVAFDHATNTVYYRITAIVLVDGIRLDLLQAYLQGLMLNARELREPFGKVLEGLAGESVLSVVGGATR